MRLLPFVFFIMLISTESYPEELYRYYDDGIIIEKMIRKNDSLWLLAHNGYVYKWDLKNQTYEPVCNAYGNHINSIKDIHIDKSGIIRMSHGEGNYISYDGESWKYSDYCFYSEQAYLKIVADSSGKVWFGSSSGLFVYRDGSWLPMQGNPDDAEINGVPMPVTSLSLDANEVLWVGTKYWLYRYSNDEWERYSYKEQAFEEEIRQIAHDASGNTWIAGLHSLYRLYNDKLEQIPLCDSIIFYGISSLAVNERGNLFVGTSGVGLYILENGEWTHVELENEQRRRGVEYVMFDDSGMMFMTSNTGTLDIMSDASFSTYILKNGLSSSQINDVAALADTLFVGSGSGLSIWNGDYWECYDNNYYFLDGSNVLLIESSPAGEIWIGTDSGVTKYSNGQWENWNSYSITGDSDPCNISDITFGPDGTVWVGSKRTGGIYQYDSHNWTCKGTFGEINALAADSNDGLWAGTRYQGVGYYTGDTWVTYDSDDGLNSNKILDVAIDIKGNIWCGTGGGGLSMYNGEEWQTYTTRDGLLSDEILCLDVDSYNNLWIVCYPYGIQTYDGISFTGFQHNPAGTITSIECGATDRLYIGTASDGLYDYTQTTTVDSRTVNRNVIDLRENYPNPFNVSTTIQYTITRPGTVSLAVYSVSGQKVTTLVDDFMPAGTHAAVFDGSSLASGLYLYRFEATGFAKTGKIMLVK